MERVDGVTEFRIEVAAFREPSQLEAGGMRAANVRGEQVFSAGGPVRRYHEYYEDNLKQHEVRCRHEV